MIIVESLPFFPDAVEQVGNLVARAAGTEPIDQSTEHLGEGQEGTRLLLRGE
jgi:hypothetical protein